MVKSPKTFTSHSPPRARTLSGRATRRRSTQELLQTRNRAFGPNGVPTTSPQTSATRTDTTSRLPISLGFTNKRYDPSTHLRPAWPPRFRHLSNHHFSWRDHDRQLPIYRFWRRVQRQTCSRDRWREAYRGSDCTPLCIERFLGGHHRAI